MELERSQGQKSLVCATAESSTDIRVWVIWQWHRNVKSTDSSISVRFCVQVFRINIFSICLSTKAVCKVCGRTLLLRVGNLWRCGDGLFFEVTPWQACTSYNAPPTSRKRAADRWSLRNFLPRSFLFMFGKVQKSHGARYEWNCIRIEKSGWVEPHQNIRHAVQISPHAISGLFQPWKGSSEARNFEMINGLQHVFGKWVERCKKCIAFQGRYSKKRPSPHLHKVPTRSDNVSPRTSQTALVCNFMLQMSTVSTEDVSDNVTVTNPTIANVTYSVLFGL
jgi:hypothetical protein